ncbi:hypothetical protein JCGZ_25305 [Jatropha curcas]|uniref:Aminotransferase-like plant mobile domain-containing protein n=1 Tax=Jatropha curcas TaxID=180498 RepID=A0A067JPX6_JATCU|nr:hypothetical protein JCGZ_25305 [Jatropha curcas]
MSQLSEIPASAYTPEMETLGALPDIPMFDGEPVPVSRNPLTPGLQPLPLSGTEFPVRYETSRMHGFQFEVNLGKARSGGSATDAFAFWDLLDPPMRARVVAAGFGDYAVGLRRTQPRFLPAMRYALMERYGPMSTVSTRALSLTLWDCEAWRTYSGREVAEFYTRSRLLMRGYWADRYFLGERVFDTPVALARRRELENGRLRRHQSRQSSALSRLQAEVERLRTRLEVEGIPARFF